MANMKTDLSQKVETKQEMKVNPRLYQAMDLLYMPLMDLKQHLNQELQSNPFLDLVELGEEQETPEEELEEQLEEEEEEEIDWEEILLNGFDVGGGHSSSEYEEKEIYRPTPQTSEDLWDKLRDQLKLLPLNERGVLLGEEIIGNIDREGFLTCSLEEIVESVNEFLEDPENPTWEGTEQFTMAEAERLLEEVHRFDPSGVGARDLRECILIQLRDRGQDDSLTYRIVDENFDELVNHRWSEISKEYGIDAKEVQEASDKISKLDPKPGLKYAEADDEYVIPDLIVDKIDGEYYVFHNDNNLPRLKLSKAYKEVAKDKSKFSGENKSFISKKLNSAQWMIQAIEQRRQTMLKVMNFIVDRQREYFEKGVEHLKPLTLREVAEHIDMHESTVSRVTNDKYAQTPRGVLPLKFFFSSGLDTDDGGQVSARGVRARIEKIVDEEDSHDPHTDQEIVDRLKEEGIQIARRTVAKYRDQLGILSARMRKRV
ncbi:MAG: RNA polymerase factor sigma-54 [Candidatus Palauibacterales bacterium]|nr:RNA polymerase factor sigma-54 [Candidatus Palauibacterales bacterium]